mmetsp:Transcript_44812/g.81759  ORF Transcript_44812/g.81759 Transcript_44812/m.81759 type:complete len:316 (+) Transcript_44812:1-948(+)
MNYAFMKADGVSDRQVREEVNKKCRFSMCMGCMGGGDTPKPSIPCCSQGCELKEDTPSVHEMAETIGKPVTSAIDEFDDEGTDNEEDDQEKDFFAPPKRTIDRSRFGARQMPAEVMPIVEEYKATQGEVCSYDHGNDWCVFPAKNMGPKFSKNGKPLCCQTVAEVDVQEEREDVDKEAQEWMENSKKPVEEQSPVIDLGCTVGSTFALKPITLKGVQKSVCMNEQTKLPADKRCCAKEAPVAMTFDEAFIAEEECGDVNINDCKTVKKFEKLRNKKYKGKIPGASPARGCTGVWTKRIELPRRWGLLTISRRAAA